MAHGRSRLTACLFLALVLVAASATAYAQGGAASSLAGTVTDSTGAVVPGADVVVKNTATGTVFTAVTAANGSFNIPSMPPGTYTATVSLLGFKTVVLNDVILNVGVPASVKAVLQPGGLEETVVVAGASEVIQTQTASVASTMTSRQIANLPLAGRAAFDLIGYVPGVVTSTGSLRDGTVNGLTQASVNITLDGMNIQDNYAKTWDGMFTRVNPRIDAVEEVSVTTAAQGADTGGQGSVQMRFVTRSGTNTFQGSGYYYLRQEWMNTNTWFNIHRNVTKDGKQTDKAKVDLRQPGFRLGGPIMIPGLFNGRDKAFFFVNWEMLDSPGTRVDTRTIMSPNAEKGIFDYGSGRSVNLFQLAAANGHVSTIDPTVQKLLADVRASTSQGTVNQTDPLVQSFAWTQPAASRTYYPTVRVDYNLTTNHRLSFSTTQNWLLSNPDTTNSMQRTFPGFPAQGLQDSDRYTWQTSLRSVLTKNMVNEFRLGGTGGATLFSPDLEAAMFAGGSSGVGNQGGYAIRWDGFKSLTNVYPGYTNSSREGSTKVLEDTLNWLKNKHSLSFGASITRADVWLKNKQHVPRLVLGRATGDPADSMFNTTNFPGASSTDITNARNLYSVLTGRISAIERNARIGPDGETYVILGESLQQGRLWDLGFHAQDSWRVTPTLTLNGGVRYAVQLPFYALNNSYSTATVDDLFGITGTGTGFVAGSVGTNYGNLFKPGVLQGTSTTYEMLTKDTSAYKSDLNNVAPSVGLAWTTGSSGGGLLRKIFGAPGDSVIRGGYNVSYQRGGMSDFTEVYGNNPGIVINAIRNTTNGNLGTLPVLLRSSDLGAPAINLTRQYPMAVPDASAVVRTFDPDITVPWSESYQIGMQRALSKNWLGEVRYVHTASHGRWTLSNLDGQRNYNEVNIIENGFFNEFKLAQKNLMANIAAGKGNTFAYTGAPGTVPLPIFLANLNGSASQNNSAAYTGSGWTDSTLVQSMYMLNPNPQTAASTLRGSATYKSNMAKAGLPPNFWVVNPEVATAAIVTNGPGTDYNGIQLVLNRRFSNNWLVQSNYSFGKGYQGDFYSFRVPYQRTEQSYTNGNASLGNIRHSVQANWVWELPFGQGQRYGSGVNGFVNRLIGGWSLMGLVRLQTGRLVDFGNVRMVGFDKKDLQKMFKARMTTDPNNQYRTLVWVLPQDVIDNTVKAHSFDALGYTSGEPTGRYFAPANGPSCIETVEDYGACGTRTLVAQGPMVFRSDMTIAKQIPIKGSVRGEFQLQVFNVFNRTNFNPVTWSTATGMGPSVPDAYQVTSAVDSARTMQMAFRVSF